MKNLFALCFIARHARANFRLALLAALLANVAALVKPIGWYRAQDDWLHGGYVAELNLRNIQGADDVGEVPIVGALECAVFGRTKLASLQGVGG